MARAKHPKRVGSGFNLGGQQAEADPLLSEAFFETSQYAALSSREDPRCFVIGRTGSGKSALLNRIVESFPEHVIRISPEDLALPYVADLQAVRLLNDQGVHLDPLFIALWKHVLLIEVIRHRYKVDSSDAKQNFLSQLKDKIKRDTSKLEALKYLDDFQGRFWCEADERVREIADRFESQVKGAVKAGVASSVAASATAQQSVAGETRSEWVARYQRIVNETQLPRLNQMVKVLDEDILNSVQNYVFVVIDDLDQDWVDDSVSNSLIRCLFRAVLDLKKVEHLKILVALRTNIFAALDYGQRTGGQEEKFRALAMRVGWSEPELRVMLDERVRAAAARLDMQDLTLKTLLPAKNKTRGDAFNFMVRRTLLRPRDLIAYANECLEGGVGRPRITWDDLHDAETQYSHNRLLALRDEWKPTYPDVYEVFSCFSSVAKLMDRKLLTEKLDDVALLAIDPKFEGTAWLGRLTIELWSPAEPSWEERYGPLVQFLYRIGFLGCSAGKAPLMYAQQDVDYLERRGALARVDGFSVHPAFRSALGIETG